MKPLLSPFWLLNNQIRVFVGFCLTLLFVTVIPAAALYDMHQLQNFGVNPGLPRSEFVSILQLRTLDVLRSLRAALFTEACAKNLVSQELQGLPLVNQRDTALRPATKILGEDIWHIINSISNNVIVPRVLFKNGKKSKCFLENASRPILNSQPPFAQNISTLNGQTYEIENAPYLIQEEQLPPTVLNVSTSVENEILQSNEIANVSSQCHLQTPLPSSTAFSHMLITREINKLKDELRSIKSDLAELKRMPAQSLSVETQCQFSPELMDLRQEVSSIRNCLAPNVDPPIATSIISPPSEVPVAQTAVTLEQGSSSFKTSTTFNCRGLKNSIPYLHHLIEGGADIIAVTEHWLWPYQLQMLEDIHPSYTGFGHSDNRLDEHSDLVRGCGGVGIIWNRSFRVTPVTSISSDRLCAVKLFVSDTDFITILYVYLPSSDYSFEEFKECVTEMSSAAGALESSGPVILLGDFNTHLSANNDRSELLLQVVQECNLYSVSTSSIANGPSYTFFSGERRTRIDYIFLDASLAHSVAKCYTHGHHCLNLSDHLPISISLRLDALTELASCPHSKVNWTKSVDRGMTYAYAAEVSKFVSPLLSIENQSTTDLNLEVLSVSKAMLKAAYKYLPVISHRKKKTYSYVKDEELRGLCRASRDAWMKWKGAGRPSDGSLYERKCSSRKLVRQHVAFCRARLDRAKIQARDLMFKENQTHRFKHPKHRCECKCLLIDGQIMTDPVEIASHFKEFYQNLCSSSPTNHLDAATSTITDLEDMSFWNKEDILDTQIDVAEIEGGLRTLKLGKSGGIDGLDPEHLYYGGEALKLWLKKIFNRFIALEEVPNSLNEGLVIPVYKKNGKDPHLPGSYRGITLSSAIIKVFEIILLRRLTPILDESGFPDLAQTAYQKGLSCIDAIYATQETLLTHVRENGKPLMFL